MSPDDTSSMLCSFLTTNMSHGSVATPTNEGYGGAAGMTTTGGDVVIHGEEEDVFSGTWSELLTRGAVVRCRARGEPSPAADLGVFCLRFKGRAIWFELLSWSLVVGLGFEA
jgi:hypothetical protein